MAPREELAAIAEIRSLEARGIRREDGEWRMASLQLIRLRLDAEE